MSRICFVGNSHLASIKLGWDRCAEEFPGIEATFFGSPADTMNDLKVGDGGVLRSGSQRLSSRLEPLWGTTELKPDDFDVLCIIGMGTGIRSLQSLYRNFRSDLHANRQGRFRRLSQECFTVALAGMASKSLAARTARRIRAVSERPILVAGQPAPSVQALADPAYAWLKAADETGDAQLLLDMIETNWKAIAEIEAFIHQPPESKASPASTKTEYAVASTRLKGDLGQAHDDDDFQHMNGLYGSLVVRQVVAHVAGR